MNASSDAKQPPVVKYNDFWVRILMSVFAAYQCCMIGVFVGFRQVVKSPTFYIAFFGSMLIAFGLVSYVRALTKRLDQLYTWDEDFLQRVLWQLFLGVAAAFVVAFVAAYLIIYRSRNIGIFETGWLDYYGFPVCAMLTLLNLYYYIWYQRVKYNYLHKKVIDLKTDETDIKPDSDLVHFVVREDGYNVLYRDRGKEYSSLSLEELYKSLNKSEYEYLNRCCIISRGNILHVKKLEDGRYDVYLKFPEGRVQNVSKRQGEKLRGFIL